MGGLAKVEVEALVPGGPTGPMAPARADDDDEKNGRGTNDELGSCERPGRGANSDVVFARSKYSYSPGTGGRDSSQS